MKFFFLSLYIFFSQISLINANNLDEAAQLMTEFNDEDRPVDSPSISDSVKGLLNLRRRIFFETQVTLLKYTAQELCFKENQKDCPEVLSRVLENTLPQLNEYRIAKAIIDGDSDSMRFNLTLTPSIILSLINNEKSSAYQLFYKKDISRELVHSVYFKFNLPPLKEITEEEEKKIREFILKKMRSICFKQFENSSVDFCNSLFSPNNKIDLEINPTFKQKLNLYVKNFSSHWKMVLEQLKEQNADRIVAHPYILFVHSDDDPASLKIHLTKGATELRILTHSQLKNLISDENSLQIEKLIYQFRNGDIGHKDLISLYQKLKYYLKFNRTINYTKEIIAKLGQSIEYSENEFQGLIYAQEEYDRFNSTLRKTQLVTNFFILNSCFQEGKSYQKGSLLNPFRWKIPPQYMNKYLKLGMCTTGVPFLSIQFEYQSIADYLSNYRSWISSHSKNLDDIQGDLWTFGFALLGITTDPFMYKTLLVALRKDFHL